MNSFMFKEISPYPEASARWNDVTINAGAFQSTLQDIKLPESAGCYTYRQSCDFSSSSSNRFIYWRTNHDVVELVEISLDVTLKGNHLRMHFQNTPILRGLSIHETNDKVVVLVATVSAIHKLMFPHPSNFDKDNRMIKKREQVMPSIFFDTSNVTLRDRSCYFVLNNVSQGIPLPHTACSWLATDGSAAFVLANSAGSLLLVVMSDRNGIEIVNYELMKTPAILRLFNGFVPSAIRSNHCDIAVSIVCHQDSSDVYIFSLFSDLQLRMWSYKRQECLMVSSMLSYDTENKLTSGNFTAHQCCLQKSVDKFGSEFYLGVYIPTLQQKHFYIFKLMFVSDRFKLALVTSLHQTEHDLIDFCLSSTQVWTLWLSSENQSIVLVTSLNYEETGEPQSHWIHVELISRVSRNINLGKMEPREVYLNEIFKAGRFLPSTISKAISIYNTALNANFSSEFPPESKELRIRAIKAVEAEILMKSTDSLDIDEDYAELQAECWDRLFSYCIQYHEVGMKPLGLSLDPTTGLVILIKKNFYSMLCPCDPLEQLALWTSNTCVTSLFSNPIIGEDLKLYSSIKAVLSCTHIVSDNINQELLTEFEDQLFHLNSPIKFATEICKGLDLKPESNFLKQLNYKLPSYSDVVSALSHILSKIDLSDAAKNCTDLPAAKYPYFMNSSSGVSALCAGLTQFARKRYEFCRDILLLEIILWGLETMDGDQMETLMMQSNIIPSTVLLLRSYYITLWCTKCEASFVSEDILQDSYKQLCILEFQDCAKSENRTPGIRNTLIDIFFQDQGGLEACKLMEYQCSLTDSSNQWASLYPRLILNAATLLWPLEGSFLFSEFLFSRCQYLALQHYNNLLSGWCSWNKQSRNFLVASSHLILGEPCKAYKLFVEVSKEIEGEYFLCDKLLKGRYNSNSSVVSLYCMRVIQMFEQFFFSTYVIQLASRVIDEVDENDSHVPIFYSILFKHYLDLGQSEMAFTTLIKNPDVSRSKDCLRQLIVKLCEGKEFESIIRISHLAVKGDVISILESRARCSDLKNQSYYDLLFSIHVHHKKYRKAACVMYEHGMRLGRELNNLEGLEKQASCYLAAINCLHLAEPTYAWIVKPANSSPSLLDKTQPESVNCSPKRNADGEEIESSNWHVKVEVVGLKDIEKEYDLVRARLLHAQRCHCANISTTPLTAEETVAILVNASLFDAAIQLSKSYSLSLVPVFETLAYRCISSVLRSERETAEDTEAFNCLRQNNPSLVITNSSISPHCQIWYLLKYYLNQHEKKSETDLHKCVVEKLLSSGIELPAWLQHSYQKLNSTELLSLYISHGCFENAVELTVKYVKAIMGVGKEDFDMKFSLHANSHAVWLPHTYIDILLDSLSDSQDSELYHKLIETLDVYNETVEKVSKLKLDHNL